MKFNPETDAAPRLLLSKAAEMQRNYRQRTKFAPKTEAIAYRIWGFCRVDGWNFTTAQIAEGLGETSRQVSAVIILKGWQHRLRSSKRDDDRTTIDCADNLEGLTS